MNQQPIDSSQWNKSWTYGWFAIILGLLFYEFWSGFGPAKHTPMLTQVIVKYFKWYVTMPVLTWMWFHFALRYINPNYIR